MEASSSRKPDQHLDVLPTLCELAGVKIPASLSSKLDGFSLVPLLESQSSHNEWHKDRILFHHVARWPSGFSEYHKYTMAGESEREIT